MELFVAMIVLYVFVACIMWIVSWRIRKIVKNKWKVKHNGLFFNLIVGGVALVIWLPINFLIIVPAGGGNAGIFLLDIILIGIFSSNFIMAGFYALPFVKEPDEKEDE
ncbi:MAG: hypothetical protein FWD97_09145 [Defluviitaleaceae bacterium]|nr:hypothetical protein [Defluviitaleaceae bacterium]